MPRLSTVVSARPDLTTVLVTMVGVVLAGSLAWISLTNPVLPRPGLNAAVGSTTVASMFGVGLYAWRREPANHFGWLLMLGGVGCFLAALSTSSQSLLYSVGRVSFWLVQPLLILLFLAYPSGALPGRRDKFLVAVTVACVVVLYLPTALVVEQFPLLPAYCTSACPANAFRVLAPEPGFVEAVVVPLRETITVAIYLATALLMITRLRESRLMFRSLVPVTAAVIVRCLALSAAVVARIAGASARQFEPFVWAALISVPVAALGFLVGLLRWRVYSAGVLEKLALEPEEPADASDLRRRLAEALEDPNLEVYVRQGDSTPATWRDHSGRAARLPSADGRCHASVQDHGQPIAVLVCDPAFSSQRSVVDAAAGWVRAVLVRQRLRDALNTSLHDVELSRRRLARAVAMERRRIERDIHDGAQQQLVTLRLKLALAAEELKGHPDRGAQLLEDLGPTVDSTIEEVRSLAHGIYPALLADAGLVQALQSVARSNPTPTVLHAGQLGRYPLEIEAAVYFCCLEAIQNATKHAAAGMVVVSLAQADGELHFEVCDDGRGFSPEHAHAGMGLSNMRDRAAALGGSLRISSGPGRGTLVRASVPVNGR